MWCVVSCWWRSFASGSEDSFIRIHHLGEGYAKLDDYGELSGLEKLEAMLREDDELAASAGAAAGVGGGAAGAGGGAGAGAGAGGDDDVDVDAI